MAQGAVVGLDIGTRMIKFCEVRAGRDGPEVVSYGASPTPADAISSTGVIVDPGNLAATIRDLLTSSGARTRKVNCCVTSQSSLIARLIEVPRMSADELAETMRWEVERYIPFATSEVIVDYQPVVPIDQVPEDAQNMQVLLAAGLQDMVNGYIETLTMAKLEPLALDVEPPTIARALVDLQADAGAYDKVIALVSIGAGSTDITIISKGLLSFTRPVQIGGDSLTNAISDAMGRPFEEAEKLKVEEGLVLFDANAYRPALGTRPSAPPPPTVGPPTIELARITPDAAVDKPVFDLGDEIAPTPATPEPVAEEPPAQMPTAQTVGDTMGKRVFESMAPTLAELVTEIRRSLDFYSSRSPQAPVEKVLLAGGTSRLPNFPQFLSNELGLPVELADPFLSVNVAGGVTAELKSLAPMFPVALGMGIRDMLD